MRPRAKPEKVQNARQALLQLLLLTRYAKLPFALGLIALLAGVLLNLALPLIVRWVLQEEQLQLLAENTLTVALLLSAFFALQGVSFFFRSYLLNLAGHKIVLEVRKDVFSKILEQDLQFFARERSGSLVSRIVSDIEALGQALSINLSVLVRYSIQSVGAAVLMILLSPYLAGLTLLIIPIVVGSSIFFARKLRVLSRELQDATAVTGDQVEEVISHAPTVYTFLGRELEKMRYTKLIGDMFRKGKARSLFAAFFASFVSFLLNLGLVFVLIQGIGLVISEQMPLADLTAFLLYGVIVAVSFGFVSGAVSDLFSALGATDRIREILSLPNGRALALDDTAFPTKEIKAVNIQFSYHGRGESPALRDVSFSVPAGAWCSVIGESGSGKSTLLKLLMKIHSPSSGILYIGERDLQTLPDESLWTSAVYVPQEPWLFNQSLRFNLCYPNLKRPPADIDRVLGSLGLLSFVDSLPNGLETNVGAKGFELSGGQKQRVALARALLRKPNYLFLDEVSSALDVQTELQVMKAIREICPEATLIQATHRASVASNSDLVLVMGLGEIVQSGSPEELRNGEGLFREMLRIQKA